MMKFKRLAVAVLLFSPCLLFAESSHRTYYDKAFYIQPGLDYEYESIKNDPEWRMNSMFLDSEFGYDFGNRLSINASLGLGMLTRAQCEYWKYVGYSSKFTYNMGLRLGLNMGVKILNTNRFDIVLPVGILFAYDDYGIQNKEKEDFTYKYLNVESGLQFIFRCNNRLAVVVPFNVGYPVYKKLNASNYDRSSFDNALNLSAGLALRIFVGHMQYDTE
jgi:hypothetical protein